MDINMVNEIDFINANGLKAARNLIEAGDIIEGINKENLIILIEDHDIIIEIGGLEAAINAIQSDSDNQLLARAVKNLS
nr:hypothetical protein [Moraxella sp. CTOTU47616]